MLKAFMPCYIVLFPYCWNPFKNIFMSLQTFLLMSIAIERFLLYILPSIALATMVNIPKFFETKLVSLTLTDADNNTEEVVEYKVTNLRLDENYVFY